jgi:hypothetical protein
MIENTEEVKQNGQSIETGNTGHTRQRKKPKRKTKNSNAMCVGHYYPQANKLSHRYPCKV